jgi:carboxypeptidase PM20D1
MLQKTIRELYPDAVVAPALLVVGSDSKHFTPLTDSVYRFAGVRANMNDLRLAHGTDERMSLKIWNSWSSSIFNSSANSNQGGGTDPT